MSSPAPDWHGRDRRGGDARRRARRATYWADANWADRNWTSDRGWSGERGWGGWGGPEWASAESDRHEAERRTPERRQGPVRIGDAERDQAVSLLSDHFVAGRLTQTEFEERSEQATRARYADDLAPLFDDLPTSAELQLAQGPWSPQEPRPRRRPGPPPPFMMLMPLLMFSLIFTSIMLAAPWLLWGVFWIVLITKISYHRSHQNHYRR